MFWFFTSLSLLFVNRTFIIMNTFFQNKNRIIELLIDWIWCDDICFLLNLFSSSTTTSEKWEIESTSKRQAAYTRVLNANSIRIEWKWKSEATIGPCPFMKLLQESLCVYMRYIALSSSSFFLFLQLKFVLSLLVALVVVLFARLLVAPYTYFTFSITPPWFVELVVVRSYIRTYAHTYYGLYNISRSPYRSHSLCFPNESFDNSSC